MGRAQPGPGAGARPAGPGRQPRAGGLKVGSAYDLALFPELGSTTRAVLVVSMRVQLVFNDGKADDGSDLVWADADKKSSLAWIQDTPTSWRCRCPS